MKHSSVLRRLSAVFLAAAAIMVPMSMTAAAAQTTAPAVGIQTKTSGKLPVNGNNMTLELDKTYVFPDYVSRLTGSVYSVQIGNKSVLTYKNGVFTAVGEGTTNLTIKTTRGNTIKMKVTVKTPPVSVRLDMSRMDMNVGQVKTLKAITSASKGSLSWTSSDSKVISVNSAGAVTAKKAGTATVTVKTTSGKSASCTIRVNTVKVTNITLDYSTMTLGIGQKRTLNTTVYPAAATDKSIKWSTSDSRIATVDKNGVVLAKKDGTVKITAESSNGKKKSCAVTVKPAPKSIHFKKDNVTLTIGKTSYVRLEGQAGSYTKGVTYKSSDNRVCTVSATGKITGVKPGKVTITATTYNGKTAKCTVTVK